MKSIRTLTVLAFLCSSGLGHVSAAESKTPASSATSNSESTADMGAMREFITEMTSLHKFDSSELEQLFSHTRVRPEIIEAISRPAEAKPWYEYRPIFLTKDRVNGGVAFWRENVSTLKRARDEYGVPESIIVAILGVETRYGKHTGRYPVLDALSTLAFAYPPRSSFFRKELEHYLLMTREENMDPLAQLGSYAGAMGMPQFISSSFRSYAVDFDGDGRRDLWFSTDDAIGSVGNYFAEHGWKNGEPIAHRERVKGKAYKPLLEKGLKPNLTLQQMRDAGIILPAGLNPDLKGAVIELEGANGPEIWVGWKNFYVITRYNHSQLYAMAVLQLGDAIATKHKTLTSYDVRSQK